MTSSCIYYVYAYIRSKDSTTAKAGTPYYIGKGKGKRAFAPHGKIPVPPKDYIIFLETHLTEVGALALERRYIRWYGKKIDENGILLNLTDGGEGNSTKRTPQQIEKLRKRMLGKSRSEETKAKISKAHKGIPLSKEAVEKMIASKKGKPQSADHVAKRIEQIRGIPRSTETKDQISKALTGRVFSEEHKQKLREAAKKRKPRYGPYKKKVD